MILSAQKNIKKGTNYSYICLYEFIKFVQKKVGHGYSP
jgi:hypothetical protein